MPVQEIETGRKMQLLSLNNDFRRSNEANEKSPGKSSLLF